MMSLDGFFEGKNEALDWHNVDDEFNEFTLGQLNAADHLIFGRKTYKIMVEYWPTKEAITNYPAIADRMNGTTKTVFSTTLGKANWENTKLFQNEVLKVVGELKKSSERDILIFGSANLSETLIKNGLIDVFRIMINPVILGSGNPLFLNAIKQMDLNLITVNSFKSGNVLVEYTPK
ncbi:dihydrofolate reductase [Mesonia sp. K7]|nr:dihydrofolate reductase [Mesonia sp. K7]